MRYARTHHAGPEYAQLVHLQTRHVLGTAGELHRFALVDERRADQIARHRVAEQLGEVLRLEPKRFVERHQGALEDAVEYRDRRRIVVLGFGPDRGRLERHHIRNGRVQQASAGAIALLVPRADRIGRFENPSACGLLEGGGRHHSIHHPEFQRLGRGHRLTLEQNGQGFLDADHSRQALRPSGARQQADRNLRQAHDSLGIVGDDPIVAGQRQFVSAAQRQSVDRRYKGFSAGLHAPMHAHRSLFAEFECLLGGERAHERVEIFEVRAGHECGLRGSDNCALDARIRSDPLDRLDELLDPLRRDDIHRLARVIQRDGRDPIGVRLESQGLHICLLKLFR